MDEIDLGQLENNLKIYRRQKPVDAKIMAVVKGDADGHGDACATHEGAEVVPCVFCCVLIT